MAKDIVFSIEEFLKGTPFENKSVTVGVALSGGRDSVALLHVLKNAGVNVVAVNVEHGIRGENSVKDSEFVKNLCEMQGVKLYAYSVNAREFAVNNGYTLEQAARILRYRIFDEVLNENKCDLIALAHHLDDQAETILMRILRGSGIKGLVGMKKISERYIRPLLDYGREDIDAYILKHSLEFVDDETNEDTAYSRNFLRKEIAKLKEHYPSLCESFKRLSDSAAETEEYINSLLPEIIKGDGEAAIDVKEIKDVAILKRLMGKAAAHVGVLQDVEWRHYDILLSLINAENGKYVMLPHGLKVYKQGDYLVFCKDKPKALEEMPFGAGRFESLGVEVEECEVTSLKDGLYIDLNKVPRQAVIRTRRDGDYIHKFGGGTKSLGDFLTDKKVPLKDRDSLAVIADKQRVLAVFGVDISIDVKIDESTKRTAKLKTLI